MVVSAVMSIFTGAKTVVRTVNGNSNGFEVKFGMHQGSALTYTHPFYGSMDFVWDSPGDRYQKKHSPTHTYRGHQSSLICFIHLI